MLDFRVEKYRKYYSSHWKVMKAPDQSQKLSNNQLWKAKFRGPFSAKKKLSNLALSNNQFWLYLILLEFRQIAASIAQAGYRHQKFGHSR